MLQHSEYGIIEPKPTTWHISFEGGKIEDGYIHSGHASWLLRSLRTNMNK